MNLKNFLKDKMSDIVLTVIILTILSQFLYLMGNTLTTIILVDTLVCFILVLKYVLMWRDRKRYFEQLKEKVETLKQPWLISELLPVSYFTEDKIYKEILRNIGSSAIEQIHLMEDEQLEYEEYIEEWVHEIKTPITAINLILENKLSGDLKLKKEISMELEKIENDVDRALYYARIKQVYKDYLVRKLNLREILLKTLRKNRILMMNSEMSIQLKCESDIIIYSDEKWLMFMLSQVILNAIKYKKSQNAKIEFNVHRDGKKAVLEIKDNGTGIKAEELPRIFDKGFTGSNGREAERSTGMGLYLTQKLCEKIGVKVYADSVYGNYTSLYFEFLTDTNAK